MSLTSRLGVIAAVAASVAAVAPAADLYWSGSGTWDTTSQIWGNASGGPYDQATWSNAAPDSATFEGIAGTVTLGTGITAAGVTFTVDGYTVTGNTLTLSGTPTITAGTGVTATIASVVAGSDGLTKSGDGTLVVSTSPTYSGATTISAGTLRFGTGGTGSLTLPGGTIGGAGNLVVTDRDITLGGAINLTGSGTVSITQTSAGTFPNEINLASGTRSITASSITLSGDVGNDGADGGSLVLDTSASNGAMNLNISLGRSGVTYIPTSLSANAGTGVITISGSGPGSNGWRSTPVTLTGDMNITAAVDSGAGVTLNQTSASPGVLSGVLSGSMTLTKAGAGTLDVTSVNTFSGGLIINAGTFNANANTGSGSTSAIGADGNAVTVNAGGTLLFGIARGAGFHTGPATINGGTITANAGDQSFVSGNTLTFDTAAGLFGGTGQWRRRNAGNKVAVTAAASGSTISVADLNLLDNSPVFEVADGAQAADLTISSVISGTSLTKTGAGTLTATTVNTFSGGLVINAGTFQAASTTSGNDTAGALGARGNAVTVNAGGRLEFTVGRAAGFHNGSVTVNGGTISFNSGDNSLASSNTVTLGTAAGTIDGTGQWRFRAGATLRVLAAANGSTLSTSTVDFTEGNQTFNIDSGATLTVSSGFTSDFGGVYNKAGGGTMRITTVQSNYGGSVTVNAGTLDIAVGTSSGSASGLGSGGNTVAVGTNATLLFSGGGRTAGFHNGAVTVNNGTITFNTDDNSFAVGRAITFDVGPGLINGTGQLRRRSSGNQVVVTSAASGSVISVADLNLLDTNPVFNVADGAQANDLTISGGITGGSTLTKTGTGTLAVTGSNTSFTGATAINAGTLVASHANALGNTGSITIGATSTFGVAAGVAFSRPLTITSGGKVNLGSGASVALPSVAALAAFESVSPAGAATTAEILFGSGSTTPTALTSDWVAKPSGDYFSDILSLDGTGAGNTYVLSMSYDGSFGDLNIWYRTGTTGPFAPLGTSSQGETAWNSGFTTVGQYGVDTATSTVWVVTDHNSQFVVVPEPGFGLVVAAGIAAAAIFRGRRRDG